MSLWSSALHWLGLSLKLEGAPWPPPVDFSETEAALRNNNIAARRRALDAPRAGETIVAPLKLPLKRFARADDLPWKTFACRLIRSAEATVLPLYFVGQNGPMFHAASKVSLVRRIALLVGELNRRRGRPLTARIGRADRVGRACSNSFRRPRGARAAPARVYLANNN